MPAYSAQLISSGSFTMPSLVCALGSEVEAVQGQRRGRASASKAALRLTNHCLWVTVLPQARLNAIHSTKMMDITLQFEGDGESPNLDPIYGQVASTIGEPPLPPR